MYKSHSKNVDETEAYQRMNATDIFFKKLDLLLSFVLTQTPTKSVGRQIIRESSNDGLIHSL
jgi:hypothetical protein